MKVFKRKNRTLMVAMLVAAQPLFTGIAAAEPVTVDRALLEKLQQVIEQQQQQLDALKQQMNALSSATATAQDQAAEASSRAKEAVQTARKAETVAQAAPAESKVVHSGKKGVKLVVSGQVNRALNLTDDGDKTKLYNVDNDNSNTRIRLVGTAKATDDLTLGTRWEYAVTSNESAQVSQDDESAGDFTDLRWAEISLNSKQWGKVSLGKGDTASNSTAEVDLSKTDVIAYTGVASIMGGLKFRDSNDKLTTISVSDAFNQLDGLSRKNRVRYDTPSYAGFKLSTSAIADQRYDAALTWGGKGYGFKAAGAMAIADPNKDGADNQYDGSFSLLHESTGLNFTLSAGLLEKDDQGDQTNLWGKAGWIHRFFSVGSTAFSVDYTRSTNFPTGSHDGYSVGAAAVQEFDRYGTELYAQIRTYSLSNDGSPSAQTITGGTIGTRVKF
jgi:cell division protein FtsL